MLYNPDTWFTIFDGLPLSSVAQLSTVNKSFKKLVDAYLLKTLKIQQIACGLNHTLVLLHSGRVFVMGSNQYKQLGFNEDGDRFIPTELPISEKIQYVGAGLTHSILLGKNNNLWCMGSNAEKQFSFHDETNNTLSLQAYQFPEPIESVHTYDLTVSIATASGKISTYGHHSLKPYRINNQVRLLPDWLILPKDKDIVDVRFSITHALLLTKEGRVFGFGVALYLGLPTTESLTQWTLLSEKKVRAIRATPAGSFLLTEDNELMVAGVNTEGQLGMLPTRVASFTTVAKDVSTFDAHTFHAVYVNNSNQLHAMGNNLNGALGIGNEAKHLSAFLLANNMTGPSREMKREKKFDFFPNVLESATVTVQEEDWDISP